MKQTIRLLAIATCIGLMWACNKQTELTAKYTTANDQGYVAYIKIVDAAPAFRQVFNGSDSFSVYLNGPRVNGTFLSYNSIFPTTTNLYAAVPAGPQNIRITVAGKTLLDSTLATINKNLTPGSYYSFIITDSALSTNEAKQMWLTDNFAFTDTSSINVRFVDAVINDPVSVDVYSYKKGANIFSNIKPATATTFITLPYTSTDTIYVRNAGTQTEITRLAVVSGTSTAINRTRAYTLLYKGQNGATGTKARALTFYANN